MFILGYRVHCFGHFGGPCRASHDPNSQGGHVLFVGLRRFDQARGRVHLSQTVDARSPARPYTDLIYPSIGIIHIYIYTI